MHLLRTFKNPQSRDVRPLVFIGGLLTGLISFVYYYAHHLTVAHYDAKAHLLVARRIVDSLSPGYMQMGVNWLPLTHLAYLPFVISDAQYQSGFIPSLISVFAFALSGWLAYGIAYRFTGSIAAALFAAIILLANPNLLYLQSCPLTEPLFMVLLLLATDSLVAWRESDGSKLPWKAAIWTVLAALCRYEGWYFWAGVLLLLLFDFWAKYKPRPKILKAGAVFIAVFCLPMIAHFGYVFIRLGDTFFGRVASGHPNPYVTYKHPLLSLTYHLGELSQVAEILPLLMAAAGFLLFLAQRAQFKRRLPLLLLWLPSLINISALYWGLIYRVRYSVLLIPAVAIFGSLVIPAEAAKKRTLLLLTVVVLGLPWFIWQANLLHPGEAPKPGPGALVLPVAALILFMLARVKQWYGSALIALCFLGMQIPPLAREDHPMMAETMEHEFIEPERSAVLQYLRQHYDGKRILIDMGTEAPLVYDSRLPVREFVYNEGGEKAWHDAAQKPEAVVGWLVTQKGDEVWNLLHRNSGWGSAFILAMRTENYFLYRLKQ